MKAQQGKKPIVWGLTGPTGAGKSTVTALLSQHGFAAVDADALAHEATQAQSPCLSLLAQAFSPVILRPDGSLDRAELARRAFSSEQAHQTLNDIVHPFVMARMRGILETEEAERFVLDVPLLFESGADALCDRTLAVLAPAALRLSRIMQRDGISEQRARQRMKAQPDDAFYRERADDILENDGAPQTLVRQVKALLNREGFI